MGDIGLIALYLGAIVLANGLVTFYGQKALPWTAFFLIPFDLVVRDLLQDRWQKLTRLELWTAVGCLVVTGAWISLVTTTGSVRVAYASCTAFALTGVLDTLSYQWMIRRGRLFRINVATVLAAATDSVVFAGLAFDHAEISLVFWQILTKVAGGAVWSLVFFPLFRRTGTR